MNNKQIQENLDKMLQLAEPDKCISKISSMVPSLTKDSLKEVMLFIKQVIYSKHQPNAARFQVFRLLKCLMSTKNPLVVEYTNKKIVSKLPRIFIVNENSAGFDMWVDLIEFYEKTVFELFVLVFQCIEAWGELHASDAKGKSTIFNSTYQELKTQGVEFPPSFLFQSAPEIAKDSVKRDLHRCRKLCKELKKSISLQLKKKSKTLLNLCDCIQKHIEVNIDYLTQRGIKVPDDIIWTYSELTEVIDLYKSWKRGGYQMKGNSNILSDRCCIVEDSQPKSPPTPDCLSDSIEQLILKDLAFVEREEKDLTFREDFDASAEFYKLKEKLMDTEDLAQMYKTDLVALQSKYLEVTEQKEEMMLRISAILFSNRELNKILIDTKRKAEELTSLNASLTEDVEAYRSQNDCLKDSIREIQGSLLKMEKENMKSRNYIENLENGNTALVSSNKTLKFELEKSKSSEQALLLKLKNHSPIPEIFMNPRLVGDIESLNNISLSDSEIEKPISEEEKNFPNDSLKISRGLSNEEYLNTTIPEIDIQKPEKIVETVQVYPGNNSDFIRLFIKRKEGVIYQDDRLQIGLKVKVEGEEVWGKLYIANLSQNSIEVSLLLLNIPEGLKNCMIPSGLFLIMPNDIRFFVIYARYASPFMYPPLIRLHYRGIDEGKILKIPLNFALFFKPASDILELNESLSSYEIKKRITRMHQSINSLSALSSFANIFSNFGVVTEKNRIYLAALTPCCPLSIEIAFSVDWAGEVIIRSPEKIVSSLTLSILLDQLESN